MTSVTGQPQTTVGQAGPITRRAEVSVSNRLGSCGHNHSNSVGGQPPKPRGTHARTPDQDWGKDARTTTLSGVSSSPSDRVRCGVLAHPHPGGLPDQLNPEPNNPTLKTGDSVSGTRHNQWRVLISMAELAAAVNKWMKFDNRRRQHSVIAILSPATCDDH